MEAPLGARSLSYQRLYVAIFMKRSTKIRVDRSWGAGQGVVGKPVRVHAYRPSTRNPLRHAKPVEDPTGFRCGQPVWKPFQECRHELEVEHVDTVCLASDLDERISEDDQRSRLRLLDVPLREGFPHSETFRPRLLQKILLECFSITQQTSVSEGYGPAVALHFQREDSLGTDEDVNDIPAAGVEIVDDEVPFRKPFYDRSCFFFRNGAGSACLACLLACLIVTFHFFSSSLMTNRKRPPETRVPISPNDMADFTFRL